MKLTIASVLALAASLLSAAAAQAAVGKLAGPLCQTQLSLCADAPPGTFGEEDYVGHDEPSVLFKSGVPGSGNDMTYTVTLPRDPKQFPTASGATGTTWNFQLRPTFWFGLTLCDTESAPEFTKTCNPDTDANNLVSPNPNSPNYIGKHPGNAFMELQFYGPGYVPQFEGFGCTAHQYCAAMTIDSLSLDPNHGPAGSDGTPNNADCNDFVLGGEEPINWAYITKSGQSQAPANPLFTGRLEDPNFTAVDPDLQKDLLMSPGDRIRIHMHDTPAGFRVDMFDLTTGQSGSMTASIANGFGHILYQPTSATCNEAPYAFHPEYSTANPRGNTWSIHTYNVAMSDEIGHFENCLAINAENNCTSSRQPGRGRPRRGRRKQLLCPRHRFDARDDRRMLLRRRGLGWSVLSAGLARDQPQPDSSTDCCTRHRYGSPVRPPTAAGSTTRRWHSRPTCRPLRPKTRSSTRRSVTRTPAPTASNPPMGAQFYPFYTTAFSEHGCVWQEGGNFIPGTINHFGGSSTAEYGGLLRVLFAEPGFTTSRPISDFNSGDRFNRCPTFGQGLGH